MSEPWGQLVCGQSSDVLPLTDRGLLYGDGVFETMAWTGAAVPLLARHWGRLEEGCQRLALQCPQKRQVEAGLRELAPHGQRAVLKLLVTRGSGSRGYRPPPDPACRWILISGPWPRRPTSWCDEGVRLRWCTTRLGLQPALAGIKHLNRLEQVLARGEWDDEDIAEGLMLDYEGRIIGGTMSNFFAVIGECLVTPRLHRCGVRGIMRGLLIECARDEGLEVEVRDVRPDELLGAGEMFVCNSVIGLWPIRELDGRDYARGPVTRRLGACIERYLLR